MGILFLSFHLYLHIVIFSHVENDAEGARHGFRKKCSENRYYRSDARGYVQGRVSHVQLIFRVYKGRVFPEKVGLDDGRVLLPIADRDRYGRIGCADREPLSWRVVGMRKRGDYAKASELLACNSESLIYYENSEIISSTCDRYELAGLSLFLHGKRRNDLETAWMVFCINENTDPTVLFSRFIDYKF